MPSRRARAQRSATGLSVPRAFEMWTIAKSFTSGVSSESSLSKSSKPSSPVMGM